ncbi:hypothetical protein ACJ73_07133 [Blastomyces percursus]|uniref:Uncharacterized protein n=1 Tax=Blastomyces percursus TaxID=1658174 RepID=A0A1J9R1P3_9EURO|nr:hypothetical protein ACJ73_07133 [Blastomyces percursus]
MRSHLKLKEGGGYSSYVLPNTPRLKIVIGTYVSIPCAIEFVRTRRPDLGRLLHDLEQLDTSNTTPGISGAPRPAVPTRNSDSDSGPRPRGNSVRRSLNRSNPRAPGESAHGVLDHSSLRAPGDLAQQGFGHGHPPLGGIRSRYDTRQSGKSIIRPGCRYFRQLYLG